MFTINYSLLLLYEDRGSKDGQPVTSKQVYAVICRYPDMFVKAEGRIMLIILLGCSFA